MRCNRGKTSLKLKRRNEVPMREYDRLPAELRAWLAAAVLPWRPRAVRRAFDKALAETGDRDFALTRLTATARPPRCTGCGGGLGAGPSRGERRADIEIDALFLSLWAK